MACSFLHGGGSVCLANLGGSCLDSRGSWRPGVPPSSDRQDSGTSFSGTKLVFLIVLVGFQKLLIKLPTFQNCILLKFTCIKLCTIFIQNKDGILEQNPETPLESRLCQKLSPGVGDIQTKPYTNLRPFSKTKFKNMLQVKK